MYILEQNPSVEMREGTMQQLKYRAIAAVMLIFICLAGAFLFYGISQRETRLQERLHNREQQFRHAFGSVVDLATGSYHKRIGSFVQTAPLVKQVLRSGQVGAADAAITRRYLALHSENEDFLSIALLTTDQRLIARWGQDDGLGPIGTNEQKSQTCKAGEQDLRMPQAGFSLGKIGVLYRILHPVYDQGEFLGTVVFTLDAQSILRHIEQVFSFPSAFLVDTAHLRYHWNRDSIELKAIGGGSRKWVVFSTGDTQTSQLPSDVSLGQSSGQRVRIGGTPYWLYADLELQAPGGDAVIGRLIVLEDLSREEDSYQTFVVSFVSASLVLLLAAFAVLWMSFNRFINRLIEKDKMLMQHAKMAAIGEMLAAITHQWKQPLNALGLLVDEIVDLASSRDPDRQQLEECSESAQRQILYMSDTIEDFSGFFRPSKSQQRFHLGHAVRDVAVLVAPVFSAHNISIRFACPGGDVDMVEVYNQQGLRTLRCDCPYARDVYSLGYPNEFKQALLNLFNNARDAILEKQMREGACGLQRDWVRVSCHLDEDWVCIDVADSGGGIAEAMLPRIFDAYTSTKQAHQGTGIGLYLTRMIVEQSMHGSIRAENAGGGARFQVRLPRIREGEEHLIRE